MKEAFIVSAARTAVGKAPNGKIRTVRPDDLAALAIKGALARVPQLSPDQIEDVVLGCAMPEGAQGMNIARIAAQRAGLPDTAPGVTVNRFCASGLEAIATGAGPRRDPSVEKLAALNPAFNPKGTVTAGNASQRSDGAAAVVLMSGEKVKELGLKPLARFVTYAVGGVPPGIMGIGPVAAIPKALQRAGLKIEDIDLTELNEAFACQALSVIRQVHLPPERVNVNGGAVALGHPLGATGAKLTVSILHELRRRNGRYGLVTMCVG